MKTIILTTFPLFILFLMLGCSEDNITDIHQISMNDVKVLSPISGEKLFSGDRDTIKWSNPEAVKTLDIYFSHDNGSHWTPLTEHATIPSGKYVWEVPDIESNNCKVRLYISDGTNIRTIFSDNSFTIETSKIQITYPLGNEIYTLPHTINITWNCYAQVEKFAIYYSKFNLCLKDKWRLINDNISSETTEYSWTLPPIYSNEVMLKVVGIMSEGDTLTALSDTVFAVYDNNLLQEERKYQPKYAIGNIWVYNVREDYFGQNINIYYSKKEVVGKRAENGVISYNILTTKIENDTITETTNSWITGRENYSPPYILQNGDYAASGDLCYDYWIKCTELSDTLFAQELTIKKYESGDAYSHKNIKYTEDFGKYYSYDMCEGYLTTSELKGAYIDGTVYGDTTTVH